LQATFLTGLLLLAPLAVTAWVLLGLYERLRGLSPFDFRGGTPLTLLVILLFILFIGWLSRTALGPLLSLIDDILSRVPGVSLVYNSVRDLVKAFGGEQKAFTQPVWVTLSPGKLRMIGFVTREDLESLGARGEVAVYLPHSYAISGMVVFMPKRLVKAVKTGQKDVFAFLATGGMTGAGRKAH
jgi:uncharacterized membrane protein